MKVSDAKEIVRQFLAGDRNRVGDYWGKDTVLEAQAVITRAAYYAHLRERTEDNRNE